MLNFEHVSKTYKTVIGVNDVDIFLEPGSYGLVGPNGSGKTTLINLITGGLRPTLGRVRLFDRNPWFHRGVLNRIGLCPASDVLYPNVTAHQWVRYLTVLNGYSRNDANQRATKSLEQVGMSAMMHQPMGTYSLGMRQRSKIAQAIAHEPELLILDEPFNGVDPIGRHEISLLLRDWVRQGRSLLLASHLLHEVEAVTDSFLLIHGGRLLASGAASEIQPMLADFPQEIQLTGTGLTRLAASLADQTWVNSIRFSEDRLELYVSAREPTTLYRLLVEYASDTEINVTGIHSAEGNLAVAFEALLRVHRGETN